MLYSTYPMADYESLLRFPETEHHAGNYGYVKLVLDQLLPATVEKVSVALETDSECSTPR